jgi:hypothetical protein
VTINVIMPNRIPAEKMVVFVNMFDHRVKQSMQGTRRQAAWTLFRLGGSKSIRAGGG